MKIKTSLSAVTVAASAVLLAGCVTPPASTPTSTTTTTTVPGHTIDQQLPAGTVSATLDVARCPSSSTTEYQAAQTFTAGRTGTLDQVSVALRRSSSASWAPVAVRIETVGADGKPTGTALGTGDYDGPGVTSSGVVDLPLDSPAAVTAGTKYALVLSESSCATPAPANGWVVDGMMGATDNYAGGQAWLRTIPSTSGWRPGVGAGTYLDLFFATWVR